MAAEVAITRTDLDVGGLRRAAARSRDGNAARRMLALALARRPAQLVVKAPAELEAPATDALVGDHHTALSEQQLDIPQAWFDAQPDLDPEHLVFIDESGASTKMARLRGRA